MNCTEPVPLTATFPVKPAGAMAGVTIDPFVTPVTSVASAWICSSGGFPRLIVLLTFTATAAVPVLLAASYALAIKVCDPFGLVVLFHEKLNAEAVPLVYKLPSTYNSTFFTPTLSDAIPFTRTLTPQTVAPASGHPRRPVGGGPA